MGTLELLVFKTGAWSPGERKFSLDFSPRILYNIIIDS
jgi:hypothetical protein